MYRTPIKWRSAFTIGLLKTSRYVVSMRQFKTPWDWKQHSAYKTHFVTQNVCCMLNAVIT